MSNTPWWFAFGAALVSSAACAIAGHAPSDPGNDGSDAGLEDEPASYREASVSECGTTHCSADLHQVLDCSENVVTTCPAETGCGPGGTCIGACESAAANQTSIGCDFFALNPAPENDSRGSCYSVFIANTWSLPVTVGVEYNGAVLNSDMVRVVTAGGQLTKGPIGPGEVAVVFLSADPIDPLGNEHAFFVGCPGDVTPGVTSSDTYVLGTSMGKAFHITTSVLVVAYDLYPYGGATSYITSASLLLPSTAWGTNYVAADGYPMFIPQNASPYLQIVGAQDGTHVTVRPTADIVAGTGVAGTPKGTPYTYTLDKGQFVQFLQNAELAGSVVDSDKPVSVWGGSTCANVTLGTGYCDSLHQQLVPVPMLGNTYVGVRYRNRASQEEIVPWRFVGAVDGTTLTFDPPQSGAPSTLALGQLVEYSATGPFTVTSQDAQHPFYVSAYMTGGATARDVGDPDYVNIVPPNRWLSSYLFMTDPTYGNTNLVFVRGKAADGTFKDVSLDCAGTLGGWQPVGSSGAFEYTRADLVVAGKVQGACNNGAHTAKSDAPFALTVWGMDTDVSYAYPAGMGTTPINTVHVGTTPN